MNKVFEFWKRIRNLSYASVVWNYKDNNFKEIAEEFGIFKECCKILYDLTDIKYCSNCGKKLRS